MADIKQLYDGFGTATAVTSAHGPIPIDSTDAPEAGEGLVYNPTTKMMEYGGSTGSGGSGPSSSIKVGETTVTGGATTGFLYKDPNGRVGVSDSPIIGPLRGVPYSNDPGTTGMLRTDGTYLFICIGPNEWRRVLLSTFDAGGGGPLPGFAYLGLNLGNQSYYDTSQPMVDFFRTGRDWPVTSDSDGEPYDTAQLETAILTEEGWPNMALPFAAGGFNNILTYPAFNTGYPGQYTIDYDGTGTLSFIDAPGAVTHPTANRYQFTATTGNYDNQVFIRIQTSSAPPNNVRNIRLTAPCGSDDGVWNNDFITEVNGLGVIRAMETLRINNDDETLEWADRRKRGGGAGDYAALAALGIKLNLPRLWITIPQRASDDFCAQAFMALRPYVAAVPDCVILVEYTNEVWNGLFSALAYCQSQGLAAGLQDVADPLDPEPGFEYWAGLKWYCRRAAQIWDIARTVIGDGLLTNILRVIGGQADNDFLCGQVLEYLENATINPTAQRADILAIAPYMGQSSPDWTGMTTVAQVHTALLNSIATEVIPNVAACQAKATAHGVTLGCYEAGSHLYGNPALGNLFVNAVRDPGIQAVYETYIDAIRTAANGEETTICFFDSCRRPNTGDGSSWGVMEYQSQDQGTAYRLKAIKAKLPT
ncbi:MAG: hypothetical protein ACOYBP_08975 [Microbacteriaceae bacterium]